MAEFDCIKCLLLTCWTEQREKDEEFQHCGDTCWQVPSTL